MSVCSARSLFAILVGGALISFSGASRADVSEQTDACIAASERGQALVIGHKYLAARTELLACARDTCPAPIVKDCAAQLARATSGMGSIVLAATEEDGSVASAARVTLDGNVLANKVDGMAIDVDPGVHHVRFDEPNRVTVERDVLVEEGAKLKRVAVSLVPLHRPVPAPAPTPIESPGPPILAYVAGGIAVVALAGFVGFGIAGESQSHDLHALKPTEYTSSDVTALRTKLAVADICLGVSVVAAVVATYFFLTDSSSVKRSGKSGLAFDGWQMTY